MVYYSDTITYAGQEINVANVSSQKIQAPYIQKLGKTLCLTLVPTDTMAWRLNFTCVILGSEATLTAARVVLDAANDDKIEHALVDGVHDGNFICENLDWTDDGASASMKTNIKFSMTLIEKKFSGGY